MSAWSIKAQEVSLGSLRLIFKHDGRGLPVIEAYSPGKSHYIKFDGQGEAYALASAPAEDPYGLHEHLQAVAGDTSLHQEADPAKQSG